uniref:non-specific serine/threonine protein kinase n=2 Tax=Trichobilharzia regenti TaxID=157069 RepID=A0AA85IZ58_TRIRE|nr:unnamed protein product [Trichobilharzia regenti]
MKKILARFAQGDSDEGFTAYNNLGNHQSAQPTSVGRNFRLGRFSLVVETTIAEGGFGVVFRVVSQHGHTYALKRTCVNNSHDLAVCKREITIVSSVSHKNILRYVDSKITDIQPGIYEALLLTAYYPGNLSQLINERKQYHQRFTEAEVLRIFGDVCEAVCRLHHCKTPIIHRDLKVENILIDDRSNFVLCDFGSATSRVLHPGVHGLARCEDEISRYTTLAYRAPEMVSLSTTIPLGPQIDIWALGCLLYCICFFNLPFGDSVLAIQSGNFSLPDSSPYSERLHKLIGYILCVDAFKRPDIFQVCALAFTLANRSNPAQNLNNLRIPLWKDLTVPPRESQLKSTSNLLMSSELKSANRSLSPSSSSSSRSRNKSSPDQKQSTSSVVDQSHPHQQQQPNQCITNTSVVPRERPRPNCSSHHPLPPPPAPPLPPHPPSSFPHAPISSSTVNPIFVKPPTCLPVSNNNHTSSTGIVANFTDLPDSSVMPPTTNTRFHEAFSPPSTNLNWPVEFSNNHFNNQSNEMPIKWDTAATAPVAAGGGGSHQRTQSSGFGQASQITNSSETMNPYSYGQETSLSGGGGGHRRCPSDTSSLLKSFPSTIRHAQSLASLNQTSKSFDSIACSNPSVKPTDIGGILPSVKPIETSISSNAVTNRLNQSMSVDASTTIGLSSGIFNLSHASNSSPIPFSCSSASTYNTPTQNVCPNEMIRMMAFTGKDSTTININAVADDDDDDVLFGVAFDAIRGGGCGCPGVATANSTSRL